MSFVREQDLAARARYMRSSTRVNSRVPVAVEWEEGGEARSVNGYTLDISPKGCLVVVPQGFVVGQTLRVRNRVNGQGADAVLIWRGHQGPAGWELGLQLEQPAEDFWGMEF